MKKCITIYQALKLSDNTLRPTPPCKKKSDWKEGPAKETLHCI